MRDEAKQKKDAVKSAVNRVIDAVNSATTDQLRLAIEQDIELDRDECCHNLNAEVDDLKTLALLGSPDALFKLFSIATDISRFLARLMPYSESTKQSTRQTATNTVSESTASQNSEKRGIEQCWRHEMDEAANQLHEIMTQNFDSFKAEFCTALAKLPDESFSFPLRLSFEFNNPPLAAGELVSAFCDRLIQRKLSRDTDNHFRQLATHAREWPVLVSAQEYKENRKIKECAPYLGLGKSLDVDIYSGSRLGKPKGLATLIFKILDKERQKLRSRSHLEELRIDEENNVPAPIEDLLKKPITKETSKGYPECTWNIHNIWKRKAALLPNLTDETVPQWVEAAFAHAASTCDGNFENYKWPECIERRVQSLGCVRSAVNRVIKEGFDGLAKKSQNKT